MNDKELFKKKMRAGNFVINNGHVLTTINILRYEFCKLTSVRDVLKGRGIEEDEFLDSVNFLLEEGYIHVRNIETKTKSCLADDHYKDLEAKLTGKGIRLLAGGIEDNMIEA